MKRKSMVVAIVALVALFVFLAGGFTNEKYHTYNTAGCNPEAEVTTSADGSMAFDLDMPNACWSWTGILGEDEEDQSLGTRTVFDPRSTAMFVIAGLIIAIAIRLRKVKREATSD